MTDLEQIIRELTPVFKSRGYHKNRLTWYKEQPFLTVVFSIEKSQYSAGTWYYWYGISLHHIAQTKSRSMGSCQIRHRVDHIMNGVFLTNEMIVNLLDRWESMYGDIRSLRRHAVEGTLPPAATQNAKTYLTTLELSRFCRAEDDPPHNTIP